MQIGNLSAKPGEKVFGFLETSRTMSQLPVHMPVNILCGREDGPTLLVLAAVHGAEIVGSLGIGKILREVDPNELKGTLILVPVANTAGFEFFRRTNAWDDHDQGMSGMIGGEAPNASPDGTPSQQLAWLYLNELLPQADAVIDIHSGRGTSYPFYTICTYDPDHEEVYQRSLELAKAFGLREIWRSTPWGPQKPGGFKDVCNRRGIPYILPEMGGGPNFLNQGHHLVDLCAQGIKNVMKTMGIMAGEICLEHDSVDLVDATHTMSTGIRAGFLELQFDRGEFVKKGEIYAKIYHPYTGELIDEIRAPGDGYVLNAGQVWPAVGQHVWLAALSDKIERVSLDD